MSYIKIELKYYLRIRNYYALSRYNITILNKEQQNVDKFL
jgi:hypothetical protein